MIKHEMSKHEEYPNVGESWQNRPNCIWDSAEIYKSLMLEFFDQNVSKFDYLVLKFCEVRVCGN